MTDNFEKICGNISESGQKQFITFTVNDEEYGVDIMNVREIKGWTETTRLPETPEFMCGVINLRGIIIPIFDLNAKLHHGKAAPESKNVIIILAVKEKNIGIVVDSVSDILTVNESAINAAPKTDNKAVDSPVVSGLISLENRMVVLLDAEHLFDNETISAAESASAA